MRNKGFTLVELMVVVAIIIILAAILVPRYLDVTEQAKAAKCQANQRTIEGAASVWMAANNGIMTGCSVAELVADNLLGDVPHCPADGTSEYVLDDTDGSTECPTATDGHDRVY